MFEHIVKVISYTGISLEMASFLVAVLVTTLFCSAWICVLCLRSKSKQIKRIFKEYIIWFVVPVFCLVFGWWFFTAEDVILSVNSYEVVDFSYSDGSAYISLVLADETGTQEERYGLPFDRAAVETGEVINTFVPDGNVNELTVCNHWDLVDRELEAEDGGTLSNTIKEIYENYGKN